MFIYKKKPLTRKIDPRMIYNNKKESNKEKLLKKQDDYYTGIMMDDFKDLLIVNK